ncbi:MAG TPA: hypothetical protein VIP05_03055, partial [Burkholderiaceae bacterium]
MTQPRLESLFEAIANAVLGMGIGLVSQLLVFPAAGVHVRIEQNLVILLAFTAISVARSYLVRRIANRYLHRFAVWLAGKVAAW